MHEKYHYSSQDEIKAKASELHVNLPLSEDLSVLAKPLKIGETIVQNRLMIQPMEGCDGELDGAPGALTIRRYHRFAGGGAGMIWVEATAVVPEGRANPRQLMLTPQTLDQFKRLTQDIRDVAAKQAQVSPFLVLQLTHSGRYSRPEGKPAPRIAFHNPIFEEKNPIDDQCIVTDDELKRLPEQYAQSARLAKQAGFDAVDIKACHGYLLNELLSARDRPGPYGGSFENRTRLILEAAQAVRAASDIMITSRMNLYDGFPSPWGWGADEEGLPDLAEPVQLVKRLHEGIGMPLLNFTVGNPYVNPHVNRPYDEGFYTPPEHPLQGLARICDLTAQVRRLFPELLVVGSAFSYLRQYSANLAAGMVFSHGVDFAGFGRMAFAYPEFARDILKKGVLDPRKCCAACGKCSQLMRAGGMAGCVLRDTDAYLPIYRQSVKGE